MSATVSELSFAKAAGDALLIRRYVPADLLDAFDEIAYAALKYTVQTKVEVRTFEDGLVLIQGGRDA